MDEETSVEWPVSLKEKYGERHRINHKGNKLRGKGAHGGHPSTFSAGSGAELHRSCSNRFTATRNKPSDGLRHLEIPLPPPVVPPTQIPFLRPAIGTPRSRVHSTSGPRSRSRPPSMDVSVSVDRVLYDGRETLHDRPRVRPLTTRNAHMSRQRGSLVSEGHISPDEDGESRKRVTPTSARHSAVV